MGKAIVAKPSNPSTTQYLQISLISLFASIPRPADATLNWLSSSTSETSDATISQEERRDKYYVQLIQSVYKFAITGLNAPVLTTSILGNLFITLKDDVLALLAGFWSDNLPPIPPNGKGVSDEDQVEKAEFLRYVALKHGTALLNAHWSGTADREGGSGIDFQTVIPALIIALQSEERRCRDAAFECVTLLRGLAEKKFVSVYKFDVIYGADDGMFQRMTFFLAYMCSLCFRFHQLNSSISSRATSRSIWTHWSKTMTTSLWITNLWYCSIDSIWPITRQTKERNMSEFASHVGCNPQDIYPFPATSVAYFATSSRTQMPSALHQARLLS